MGQCVWLLKGSPARQGRGAGQPSGGASSTLTQSSPFTRPVAQGGPRKLQQAPEPAVSLSRQVLKRHDAWMEHDHI